MAAQRIARLTPLPEALARIDALAQPVAPRVLPMAKAVGHVLAADLVASADAPAVAVALRDGWAVRSDDVLAAGSYAGVPFVTPPAWGNAGDAMPPGTDAVAPIDAVVVRDGRAEAVASVDPGEGVLPQGYDLRAGVVIAAAGTRLRAGVLAAGIADANVRVPRLRLVGQGVTRDIIARLVEAEIVDGDADAEIRIGGTGTGRNDRAVDDLAREGRVVWHGVAIAPGETAAFGVASNTPVLILPGRPDGALAAWLTLGRHLVARLAGTGEADATRTLPLTCKIASPLGLADVIPLRTTESGVEPLAQGIWPLGIIARADGWLLVPADSEGYPAGHAVVVRPWP